MKPILKIHLMLKVIVFSCFFMILTLAVKAQTLVASKSTWKYLDNGTLQTNNNWTGSNFDESSWRGSSTAPLGFDNNNRWVNTAYAIATRVNTGPTGAFYPQYYFRKKFTSDHTSGAYRLKLWFDDGIRVYLNGQVIYQKYVDTDGNNYANAGDGSENLIDTTLQINNLTVSANNQLAVVVYQNSASSSDLLFDLQLEKKPLALTRYPYLQLPGTDKMTIRWYTNQPTNAVVKYGTDSTNLNQTAYTTKIDTAQIVELTGLYQGTTYYYAIGYGEASSPTLFKTDFKNYNFRTNSEYKSTPLRYWLLGDAGAGKTQNPRPYLVRDAYLSYLATKGNPRVDAILFLGDNSNVNPFEGLQTALDTSFFKFYNRPNDKMLLSKIPFWTVFGNHDYDPVYDPITKEYPIVKAYHKLTAASFSAFSFPIGQNKGYYSFDHGDVHFVVLNPYVIEGEYKGVDAAKLAIGSKSIARDTATSVSLELIPQVIWLRNDLANNKKKWTVVTFHIPPFSTIGHFEDEAEVKRVRERLMPILEESQYDVDAIFVSHTHAYLRAGMVRKSGSTRTTDYTRSRNLGRFPSQPPLIKKDNEAAYAYVLTGSAGRGYYTSSLSDGGYKPDDPEKVQPPSTSQLPLDDLASSTDFYHVKGGSVELYIDDTRMDIKFIKEPEDSAPFVIADSFSIFKDVNKKTTMNYAANLSLPVRATWGGANATYQWKSSATGNTILSTNRDEVFLLKKSTTLYVTDTRGYFADTIVVNIANPDTSSSSAIIPYGATWILAEKWLPFAGSYYTNFSTSHIQTWTTTQGSIYDRLYDTPYRKTIIGRGNGDEQSTLSESYTSMPMVPYKNIVTLSTVNPAGYKLVIRMQSFMSLRELVINGKIASFSPISTVAIAKNRIEVTYQIPANNFGIGQNFVAVVMFNPQYGNSTAPYTFDAQLLPYSVTPAPTPVSVQSRFQVLMKSLGSIYCAGQQISVGYDAYKAPKEGVKYVAWLVDNNTQISKLGTSTSSPIVVTLPDTLLPTETYKIRVMPEGTLSDFNEVAIRVTKTTATFTSPATSLYQGQSVRLTAKLTGIGPWNYTLSDGTSGVSTTDTFSVVKTPSTTTTFSIRSISSVCGAGSISGQTTVTVKPATIVFDNWSHTALCTGKTFVHTLKVDGPANETRQYVFELSDAQGNFNKPIILLTTNNLAPSLTLPDTLSGGANYRLRVRVLQSQVSFADAVSPAFAVRTSARATLNGVTADSIGILTGEPISLRLTFAGTNPWTYVVGFNNTDTLSGTTSVSPLIRTVQPKGTTTYTLRSITNACGEGRVAGRVSVLLITSLHPQLKMRVFPNPVTDQVRLELQEIDTPWQWAIVNAEGKILEKRNVTPHSPIYSESISTAAWQSGEYYLQIWVNQHKTVFKIAKQ